MNQVRSEFLSKVKSNQMFEIVQILDRAEQFGLMTEVVYTAPKRNEITSRFFSAFSIANSCRRLGYIK